MTGQPVDASTSLLEALTQNLDDQANALRKLTEGYAWQPVTVGESRARVVRLTAPDRPTLYLKSESVSVASVVKHEVARLTWMRIMGLPCGEVVAHEVSEGVAYMLLTAVPGNDLTASLGHPAEVVQVLAEALRQLHQISVESCPFDRRKAIATDGARANVAGGLVNEEDFHSPLAGTTAVDALRRLEEWPPFEEDLVVTHGDACLPNFISHAGSFSGYVDCGRLGVADRWQDLAVCSRSIARNLGASWVPRFLSAYGVEAAPSSKTEFYLTLDDLL